MLSAEELESLVGHLHEVQLQSDVSGVEQCGGQHGFKYHGIGKSHTSLL